MKRSYTECFRIIAIFVALMLVSPATACAEDEEFTAKVFLTWERENQEYYFTVAISMAGLIAAQNDSAHGDCVADWFFNNRTEASDELLNTMSDYPTYHPDGLILAVLQKHCGSFTYVER